MRKCIKIFVLLMGLLPACTRVQGQVADSSVTLTLLNGTLHQGWILEDVKNAYIQMRGTDKRIYVYSYTNITEIRNAKGEKLFSQKLQPVMPAVPAIAPAGWHDILYTSEEAYKNWHKAWVINGSDTTLYRIEPKDDYAQASIQPQHYGSYAIQAVGKDGMEVQLLPVHLRQLIVMNAGEEISTYISWPDTPAQIFFKVVEDGPAKLLSHKWPNRGQRPTRHFIKVPGRKLNSVVVYVKNENYLGPDDVYYMYYNHKIHNVTKGPMPREAKYFTECYDLSQKVAFGRYNRSDMPWLIKVFNHCLEQKKKW